MKLLKNLEKSLCDDEVGSKTIQESDSQCDKVQTQREEVSSEMSCSALPEHLVERILAMMPFPYIFKARVLSKAWLSKFSPISSQGDEEKAQLAISFQQQVGKWSSGWDLTSCRLPVSDQDLIAFDQLAIVCGEYFDPVLEGNALLSLSDW